MFHHLFAAMNEVLDDVMKEYPTADSSEKERLHEQISTLKTMSDTFIEEWLQFEEKLGAFHTMNHPHASQQEQLAKQSDSFVRGQGYYKLFMFEEAAHYFKVLVKEQPDFLLARIYLAMSYFRLGDDEEAYRQFQLVLPLTESNQMKAISYNAMGCIQAQQANMEKAQELFRKAFQADPSFIQFIPE